MEEREHAEKKKIKKSKELNKKKDTEIKLVLELPEHPIRRNLIKDEPMQYVEGDVFDRQRVLENFQQYQVQNTTALVLGVGGLGTNVAMGLARMGVKKIFLLDMDTVDPSNLNRQILFTKKDVGKLKVNAAKKNLQKYHNLRSEIESININAVTNWEKVVELMKESNVVFNCIDYGTFFDRAVGVATSKLGIPYISGSSYSYTIIVNHYSGKKEHPCWVCMNGDESNTSPLSNFKSWLKNDSVTVISAEQLIKYHKEIYHQEAEGLVSLCLKELGDNQSLKIEDWDKYNSLMEKKVKELLAPSRVFTHKDISFIPKALPLQTRKFGSWFSVCTGAACMMINAWIQGICGTPTPTFQNFSLVGFENFTDAIGGNFPEPSPECVVHLNWDKN